MISQLLSDPLAFVIGLIAFLASLSFHEFSHALAGKMQGDDTAERMGRLTLNPVAHVDLLGLVALVTIGFGWGKPVPFNPYNLRNQKWGPSIVAAAGPASNVLLMLVSGLLLRFLLPVMSSENALIFFLTALAYINAGLFLFNLIPLPPLDGSKFLLAALTHPKYARTRFLLETQGPMILLLTVLADSLLLNGLIFGNLFNLAHFLVSAVVGAS